MSDETLLPSLLEQDRQAALFSLPATFREALEERGEYTAERLFSQEPDKYRTIVAMLAAGRGIRAIKRSCRVHHDTIHAVAQREHVSIDTLKTRIVADIEAAIQVGAERAVEVMETIKPEQLMVGLGILIDKYQLLTGGATVRVETSEPSRGDEPRTFEEWLSRMKPAGMGLGAGENAQRAGDPVVHRMPGGLGMDAVSLAFLRGGTSDTTVATDPTISATGGGGADAPAGAVREPTHSLPENFEPKDPHPTPAPNS